MMSSDRFLWFAAKYFLLASVVMFNPLMSRSEVVNHDLVWRDLHLAYVGSLAKSVAGPTVTLKVEGIDLASKASLGTMDIPGLEVVVDSETKVHVDVTFLGVVDGVVRTKHDHPVRLHFEAGADGFRLVQSCGAGMCYPAKGLVTGDAARGMYDSAMANAATASALARQQMEFQEKMQQQVIDVNSSMLKRQLELGQHSIDLYKKCTPEMRRRREAGCY